MRFLSFYTQGLLANLEMVPISNIVVTRFKTRANDTVQPIYDIFKNLLSSYHEF